MRMQQPDQLEPDEDFQDLSQEYARLKPIVASYREYQNKFDQLEESRELAEENEGELAEVAREEARSLEKDLSGLKETIKERVLPEEPDHERDVILEIRAGTGGDEAALFAADLYRMYTRYAESKGWTVKPMDRSESPQGGFKHLTATVEGDGVFGTLQFESGTHRVQRVPETESGGRIHTSAATVAVLPEARDIDINIDESDLRVDTFRASGAGGQHVNRTDSAVRITHEPTDLVVSCQEERSQHENRRRAMQILRSRLYQKRKEEQKKQRRESRREQVGSGDRSEKIRTYNFPQNRVTDHRINLDLHNLEAILDGELDELLDELAEAERIRKLEWLEDEDDILELVG